MLALRLWNSRISFQQCRRARARRPATRGLTVQKLDNLVRSKLMARAGTATMSNRTGLYRHWIARAHACHTSTYASVLGRRLGIRLCDNDFDQYVAHLKRRQRRQRRS